MEDTEFTSDDIAQAEKPAAEASSASATQAATATAGADTKVPPVATEKQQDQFGPVPWERHEVILNNTRRDYEGKLSQLSWAERLKREEVEEALALRELYRREPDRLAEHLTKRKGGDAPAPNARDERGEAFYSVDQAASLVTHAVKQALAEERAALNERLTPIETERAQAKRIDSLTTQIQTASAWPGFADHLDAITAAIADANARREVLTLHDAYIRIVAPNLAATSTARESDLKKKWLAELNTTSVRAKDDINPQRLPAGTRKADKDKEFTEIIAETREQLRRGA